MSAIGLDTYELGDAREADRNFVLKTWARSARVTVSGMRMPREAYYSWVRELVIDRLLERGARVYVARDVERPILIEGFLVAERIGDAVCVHYAYTKGAARRRGVARDLLDHAVERLGDGAARLTYSADARILDERTVEGRRRLVPEEWLEAKLRELGFEHTPIDRLLRLGKREAA